MCMQALGLFASVLSGIGAAAQVDNEAANLRSQAEMQRRQAAVEQTTGAYQADRKREEVQRALGAQRAAYSGSGVALSGTAADVIQDSATEGEMDVRAIRWNSGMQATTQRHNAKISDESAKNVAKTRSIAFLTPVLSGVAKFGQSFAGGVS